MSWKAWKNILENNASLKSSASLALKFDQLILSKIVKIVATRCHILRLNAQNSISAGALPQTHTVGVGGGGSQCSPDLDGFKASYF